MTIKLNAGNYENNDASVRVSSSTGGWFFENKEGLRIQVSVSGERQAPSAIIGIYGTPECLLQLADFLTALASVDQSKIPHQNCPPNEGLHTTLHAGNEFLGSDISVNIGRLDAKSDGSFDWFGHADDVAVEFG